MSSIITNNNRLIININDKILLYNLSSRKSSEIKIPALEIPPNLTKNQQEALKNEKPNILTSTFSKCGKYFAICTLNKQLIVYNANFEVVKHIVVARAVSKIRFTSSCDIVIADKTGDVYLYRFSKENSDVEQLLGHLSMLLDVIVSDDEKYIVTCDRDEKIRVSQFPGSYNIESFCLGHKEFVLNLEFCNSKVLVSSSGDGTIRFWDFVQGVETEIINTNDYIKDKSLIQKFSEFMDSETVEVSYLPITCMKLFKIEGKTIIIVSLFNFDGLLIFELNDFIEFKLLQIININNIVSFDMSEFLFVLTNDDIQTFAFKNNEFILTVNPGIQEFYNSFKNIITNVTSSENISVLYKRKYDNVQEYQERKKLRIENKK